MRLTHGRQERARLTTAQRALQRKERRRNNAREREKAAERTRVRVFNPSTQSNQQTSLTSTYRRHELEKKRQYEQRVREVEHSSFTPLVLSSTGGMGKAATIFYKRLSSMLSEKRDVPYSTMIGWVRYRLSFALLRASIMSIRGARSSRHRPAEEVLLEPVEVQAAEGHLRGLN